MKLIKNKPLLLVLFFSSIFGSTYADSVLSLSEIQNLNVQNSVQTKVADLHLKALSDAAFQLGAQSGYVNQIKLLERLIKEKYGVYLTKIFNFSSVIRLANPKRSDRYILPPVIEVAHDEINTADDGRLLKTANTTYRIDQPARLVTSPPTWQQYLLFDNQSLHVQMPDTHILPKNDKEKKIWKQQSTKGWNAGVKQANNEMIHRIYSLAKDYQGMVRYQILETEHLVNAPKISLIDQGVSGDSNNMSINQSTYLIDKDASMNLNEHDWLAIPGV